MKPTHLIAAIALTALPVVAKEPIPVEPAPAPAEATLFPIPKLTGSIWERERLLGDLGGPRQTLAEHGVQLDFRLEQTYQGVASGGATDEWARQVGTDALRTLSGALLDRAAVLRNQVRDRAQAVLLARLQELGAQARARFAALPPEVQAGIGQKIAAVTPAAWEQLRGKVRAAFVSRIANGRTAIGEAIGQRIDELELGNYGNVGEDRSAYFGLWTGELKLDTAKMGLWPGGFALVRVQGQYGDAVNARSGALLPVNADATVPAPGLDEVTIPALMVTQFLSEKVAVAFGKMDTTTGDGNTFAQWGGTERFLNLAFAFNPVLARTIPYSPLGAALIVLPTKDIVMSFSVLDTEGVPTRSGFDTMFSDQTTYNGEIAAATNFLHLPGRQVIGGTYANGGFISLGQDLLAFVPRSGVPLARTEDSWSIYYNFQQYVWTQPDDPARGWGFFGRFGAADESTNPIAQFYSIGLGGNGVYSTRPHDRFGVGCYYTKTSRRLADILNLGDEQGLEAFYNFAVTPAFQVTADVQVIKSARDEVDTAVIAGVRAVLRF